MDKNFGDQFFWGTYYIGLLRPSSRITVIAWVSPALAQSQLVFSVSHFNFLLSIFPQRVSLELKLLSLIQQSFHPAPQHSEMNRGRNITCYIPCLYMSLNSGWLDEMTTGLAIIILTLGRPFNFSSHFWIFSHKIKPA